MRRVALSVLVCLAVPATASAVHWPFFGGDSGRSGYQPVGEGLAPIEALYAKTAAGDQSIRTSILTTTGTPTTMRVVYGTADGNLHLRVLGTGAAVGSETGVPIDDGAADADVFGPPTSSVSFADTSGASGLGQIFAVHNDDTLTAGDVEIAQIDQATGTLVQQESVAGTAGFTISSSAVASGTDAQGGRSLFFVAANGDDVRLFKVAIADAASTSATIGAVTDTGDIDADPDASPAVLFLNNAAGTPTAYVAVGTAAGVRTFAVSDLSPGPASPALGGTAQTPSVPVTSSGMTPGAAGTGTAPFVYVAVDAPGGTTLVQKLRQDGSSQTLDAVATSTALAGTPAPALAVSQEVSGAEVSGGKVVVTTGRNLYSLSPDDLRGGQLSENGEDPGTTGFGQTTAALSGELGYVTTDEGQQLVFDIATARPLPADQFTEHPANRGERLDNSGFGQPSIARGIVQFAGQKGLFVYRNACGNHIAGTAGADRVVGTLAGDLIAGAAENDVLDGGLGGDCPQGGAGRDTLAGGSGVDRPEGGDDVDTIAGGARDDLIEGGPDRDFITGDTGQDLIDGGTGSNVIDGGIGADVIQGGERVDSLNGGSDGDRISGNDGDDGITGASGDDLLFGNDGDDRIEGGLGKDTIRGGAGGDNIVSIDGQFDTVVCNSGRDVVRADGGDRVSRDCEVVVERPGRFDPGERRDTDVRDLGTGGNEITGSGAGNEELRGTESPDTIESPLGGDRLFGLGGNDLLSGLSGDDTADGGDGIDEITGGPGNDTLLGGEDRDFIEGGPGGDDLRGGPGSNIMNGAQGDDRLEGGEFADSLNGGSDEDRIFGRDGNDGITGASGRDRLFGEGGSDRIEGGLGRDVISGGDGGDNIVAADGQVDRIRCGAGRDVVRADGEDRISSDCELVIARRGDRYVVVRR